MAFVQVTARRMRYAAIRAGLEGSALLATRFMSPGHGGRGVIFTLHNVHPSRKDAFSPNVALSVTPDFLKQAIEAALESGLTPCRVHDLPTLLADPADKRKFVAFTLDDGYRNNAEFAAPVFREYGAPYTIYIAQGLVERTRTMWWETAAALSHEASAFSFDFGDGPEVVQSSTAWQKQVAFDRLARFVWSSDEDAAVARIDATAGEYRIDPMAIVDSLIMNEAEMRDLAADPLVHFGAHTVTHVALSRVPAGRLLQEIEASAKAVERYVGRRPQSFAYPYGGTNAVSNRETLAAAEAGFVAAVTTQPGVLGPVCIERPTALPRVSLNGLYQQKRYVKALISGLPFRFM